MELDPPPPQPILKAAAAIRIRPRLALIQIPRAVHFLLKSSKGKRRIGSRMDAVVVVVTVSVKTTVT